MTRSATHVCFLLLLGLVAGCGSKDKGVPPPPEGKTAGGASARPLSPDDEATLKKAVSDGDALWDAAVQGVKEDEGVFPSSFSFTP